MRKPAEEIGPEEYLLLPALLVLSLAVGFSQSAVKLLWADELITYYIARQPGWGGIWRALAAGADPNPPLIHILVQASTCFFGSGAAAVRLPSILCVLLAIVSMWAILRRWVSPLYAAAGVLAFMCTRGFDYSYDARSYAPLMAFALAAFALWVALPRLSAGRRGLALAGLAACLALGISSNYYGVLAFFPIGAGEAARSFQQRRLRFGSWLAMLAGALPLFAYLRLIRLNIAEFAPHAWNRPHASMVAVSYLELVEGIFWPVLALALFMVWKRRERWTLPLPESLALGVLLLYPVLGFIIATAGAGMISPRCVAPVCCGFGLALAVLASHVFGASRRAALATVALFLVWLVAREGFCATQLHEQRRSFFALRNRVAAEPEPLILAADSSFVLPLYFYSAPAVRQKIVVPIDFAAIHRYEQDDSGEQNLWAGRNGVFPFPIVPATQISLPAAGALVIARPGGWLTHTFPSAQFQIQPATEWYGLGGVFTPMAHVETRLMHANLGSEGVK